MEKSVMMKCTEMLMLRQETRRRLEFIYRGGKTQRYHTEETLKQQSVSEHSFNVTMVLLIIDPTVRKELMLAALTHDLAEHIVGDIPAPSKRASKDLKRVLDDLEAHELSKVKLDFQELLTIDELKLLKAADVIDGMMFCVDERRRGNLGIGHVYANFFSYANMIPNLPQAACQLISTVNTMWEELNGR